MLNEFKTFIARGNVMDLAVGVIMGTAFGAIVSTLVDSVIMPPIGMLLGGIDFSNFYINLSDVQYDSYAAAKEAGAPMIAYGLFANAVIKFVIVAFAVFMLVKGVNNLQRRVASGQDAAVAPAAPTKSEMLLEEIRDALKQK